MVDGVIPVQNQLGNGDELISLLKQCLDDGRQGFRGVQGGVMEQHNGAGLDLGGDPLGNFSCWKIIPVQAVPAGKRFRPSGAQEIS